MTSVFTPQQCYSADLIIAQGADFEFSITYTQVDPADLSESVVDTSTFTAEMAVRQGDTTGDLQFAITQADYIQLGYNPTPWTATTGYVEGSLTVPTVYNGYVYRSLGIGTSGGSQPTWPTLYLDTVSDGTVDWQNIGSALDELANITISLPASFTEALVDWGKGVYTLKVFDNWGKSVLFIDGKCHLRTEATYA